jgi:hypothetical protein
VVCFSKLLTGVGQPIRSRFAHEGLAVGLRFFLARPMTNLDEQSSGIISFKLSDKR